MNAPFLALLDTLTGAPLCPPPGPIAEGAKVTIDGDPCTIVGLDSDEDHGNVFDYVNHRTGRNCWISASGARVRMVRR